MHYLASEFCLKRQHLRTISVNELTNNSLRSSKVNSQFSSSQNLAKELSIFKAVIGSPLRTKWRSWSNSLTKGKIFSNYVGLLKKWWIKSQAKIRKEFIF